MEIGRDILFGPIEMSRLWTNNEQDSQYSFSWISIGNVFKIQVTYESFVPDTMRRWKLLSIGVRKKVSVHKFKSEVLIIWKKPLNLNFLYLLRYNKLCFNQIKQIQIKHWMFELKRIATYTFCITTYTLSKFSSSYQHTNHKIVLSIPFSSWSVFLLSTI